jgi:integrase/recombinase XerD
MEKYNIGEYIAYLSHVRGLTFNTTFQFKSVLHRLEKCDFDYVKLMNNSNDLSNNSKRFYLNVCRGFYRFYNDTRANDIVMPRKAYILKDYLKNDEYLKIKKQLMKRRRTFLNLRKIIIVRLLYESGIRSDELLKIKQSDIRDGSILINGKGNKQREIYLSVEIMNLIKKYIEKIDTENLFDMIYSSLYGLIKRLGKSINKDLSPHMFRRGFATYFYNETKDILKLSKAMGHADISMTSQYVKDVDFKNDVLKVFGGK